MKEAIRVYDPKKGKEVLAGQYDQVAETYHRKIKDSHIMRVAGNSVGIQEDVIQKLSDRGCRFVMLAHQNGKVYRSFFQQWEDLRPSDYGHGKQRFLSLSQMTEKGGMAHAS